MRLPYHQTNPSQLKSGPLDGIKEPSSGSVTFTIRPDLDTPQEQESGGLPPPFSREAEEAVIGSVMINPDCFTELTALLKTTDFYIHRHGWIWAAFSHLAKRGEPIDFLTTCDELKRMGKLEETGGPAYLTLLINQVPDSLNAPTYARSVKDCVTRRGMIKAANQIAQLAFDPKTPLDEVIASSLEAVQSQTSENWSDPWHNSWHTLADAFAPRPPQAFAIDGLIKLPSLNTGYGSPGDLKTMLFQDMAICMGAGVPFLPEAPWKSGGKTFAVNPYPVIWLDFDNGEEYTAERFAALARARGINQDLPNLHYVSMPNPWLILGESKSVEYLTRQIEQFQARAVFIDNLGTVKGMAKENTDEMIPVMSNLRQIVNKSKAAITFIHHQTKNSTFTTRRGDSLRGHTSIEAAVDLALLIEREAGSDILSIQSTKTRGVDVPPFSAAWTFEHKPGSSELESAMFYSLPCDDKHSPKTIEAEIRAQLSEGPVLKTELAKRTQKSLEGVGINRVRDYIDRMITAETIITTPGGKTTGQLCAIR